MVRREKIKVLWLKPKKGNVSVGRYLLSDKLNKMGYEVRVKEVGVRTTFRDFFEIVSAGCDLIVGVVRIGAYIGFLTSKIKKKPLVVDVTDPLSQINLPRFLYKTLGGLEEFIFKKSDRVIFITKNYMKEMISKGISGVKLNNGVNFEEFDKPTEKIVSKAQKILMEAGIDLSKINVLYIGSLKRSYNIHLILEAARNLKEYNFIFVGDGELKQNVMEASIKLDNVYYLGFFKHDMMPGFVYHADICLCLVNADQPLKLLEYGAASRPVIAIHGELEERFTDREVYFIDPTVKDLCRALSELAKSVKLRRKLGLNLKKRASEFQWEEIAQEYDKILRSVLEGYEDESGNWRGQYS